MTSIDFIGLRKLALVFSIALLVASIYSLATKSLNFGIDFSGGTKIELTYAQDVIVNDLRTTLASQGFSKR